MPAENMMIREEYPYEYPDFMAEAPHWIGFGLSTVALIIALFLLFFNKCAKGHRDIIVGALGIIFLTWSIYVTLLLQQGYYTRFDGVEVQWARFAFLIAISIIYALILAKWLWHEKVWVHSVLTLLIIGTTYSLFAILSSGTANWVWAIISLVVILVSGVVVVCYKKRKDGLAWVVIGLFGLSVITYIVLTALSPGLAYVLDWETFDWIIVFVDLIFFLIIPILLAWEYQSIYCKCIETPEPCCKIACGGWDSPGFHAGAHVAVGVKSNPSCNPCNNTQGQQQQQYYNQQRIIHHQ